MDQRTLTALILEDSQTQAKMIATMLARESCESLFAHSSREFYGSAALLDVTVDLVLIDIGFGGVNGMELIPPVKRRWPASVIVVMTANSANDFGGLADARKRGADLVLTKPFFPPQVADLLKDVRRLRSDGARRAHVVVIDDSRTTGKIATQILTSYNYRATAFEKAEDAIQRLNYDHVDVVLTDLNMPGMGGMEVIQLVRDVWPDVGIVAMTGGTDGMGQGESTRRDLRNAQSRGADRILLKPFSAEELAAAISSTLRDRQDDRVFV